MPSPDSPVHQLALALEVAGTLARQVDDLTDALVLAADAAGELTQQEVAELIGARSASTVNHRLARLRGTRRTAPAARAARQVEDVEQVQATLRGLLARGEVYLAERDTPELGDDERTRIGWTDHEYAWLHPVTTRNELNRHGQRWTSQSLSEALAASGVIATRVARDGTVRRSVAVRVGQPRTVVSAWQLDAQWLSTANTHAAHELDDDAADRFEALTADLEVDTATAEQTDDLRAIADTSDTGRATEARLREAVQLARAHGRSWNQIAVALGVSRQAARQRYAETAHA